MNDKEQHLFQNSIPLEDLPEEEDPCDECLSETVNLFSHKPVRWEEADE